VQQPADDRAAERHRGAIRAPVQRWRRSASTCATTAAGVARGEHHPLLSETRMDLNNLLSLHN
jgi:hypothetical protein